MHQATQLRPEPARVQIIGDNVEAVAVRGVQMRAKVHVGIGGNIASQAVEHQASPI